MMTVNEFLSMLKTAHDVPNYYNNKFPKNLGYFDGSRYSFDCWNLIKVVLSGWKPTGVKKSYIHPEDLVTGDIDGVALLKKCTGRSKDFTKLCVPGTYLYLASRPHSGIYIGDTVIGGKTYNVIECTKNSWGNGVLYSYVDKDGARRQFKGSSSRSLTWTEYGLLTPYVNYDNQSKPIVTDYSKYPVLQKGSEGEWVKVLQRLLLAHGCDPLGIDGDFGKNTDAAVRKFQRENKDINGVKLEVDGCVGPKTWGALYK